MESFKTARKLYRPVKTLERASELTKELLSLARKSGLHPQMYKRKIRIYNEKDTPVLQIRGVSRKTPSVFIHIHARTEDEKEEFFSATGLSPEDWKQPPGWTPYQYRGDPDRLLFNLKQALPVLLERAELRR